jgi:hypothetical protein
MMSRAFGVDPSAKHFKEPRFLENVQLMVEAAAQKVKIQPDMLKYITSCDDLVRF